MSQVGLEDKPDYHHAYEFTAELYMLCSKNLPDQLIEKLLYSCSSSNLAFFKNSLDRFEVQESHLKIFINFLNFEERREGVEDMKKLILKKILPNYSNNHPKKVFQIISSDFIRNPTTSPQLTTNFFNQLIQNNILKIDILNHSRCLTNVRIKSPEMAFIIVGFILDAYGKYIDNEKFAGFENFLENVFKNRLRKGGVVGSEGDGDREYHLLLMFKFLDVFRYRLILKHKPDFYVTYLNYLTESELYPKVLKSITPLAYSKIVENIPSNFLSTKSCVTSVKGRSGRHVPHDPNPSKISSNLSKLHKILNFKNHPIILNFLIQNFLPQKLENSEIDEILKTEDIFDLTFISSKSVNENRQFVYVLGEMLSGGGVGGNCPEEIVNDKNEQIRLFSRCANYIIKRLKSAIALKEGEILKKVYRNLIESSVFFDDRDNCTNPNSNIWSTTNSFQNYLFLFTAFIIPGQLETFTQAPSKLCIQALDEILPKIFENIFKSNLNVSIVTKILPNFEIFLEKFSGRKGEIIGEILEIGRGRYGKFAGTRVVLSRLERLG